MLDKLTLIQYQQGLIHDGLLIKWFIDLIAKDEYEKTFYQQPQSIKEFYDIFSPPTKLVFAVGQDAQIVFASWGVHYANSIIYNVYADPAIRTVKTGLRLIEESHDFFFDSTMLVLAVTRYPKVVDQLQRLGYNQVGWIPALYGGVTLLSLTLDDWRKRSVHSIERSSEWAVEKEQRAHP